MGPGNTYQQMAVMQKSCHKVARQAAILCSGIHTTDPAAHPQGQWTLQVYAEQWGHNQAMAIILDITYLTRLQLVSMVL
jgi:hypothetical protein